MRLHRLTVTAFGPFAGTEPVDFDELAAAGLFLFTGPTGAGKTSILDAVCFALYGQVPGARAQAPAPLRSDHAAEGRRPPGRPRGDPARRRLRVTRSPPGTGPSCGGTGTTLEQAGSLWRSGSAASWVTQTTRLDEAGQLLGGCSA